MSQVNARGLVQAGYDRIAERYVEWVEEERSELRMRYTQALMDALPYGARVLDLGCGAGGPTTRALAGRFRVTGVDISARSVALAQQRIPQAHFVAADMTELGFAASCFDGVAAFYSIIHVPRQDQAVLLERIATWLRPDGILVATMGAHSTQTGYDEDFFDTPMYWSTYDSDTNRRLVQRAGLEIVQAREETEREHGEPVTFLWIVARKPASPS